jgi:predicted  nucleic acid-binding Zn-ribbon protein
MSTPTHGRCTKCKVIFRWHGRPLLKHAGCPRCGLALDRTAASLARHILIVDENPVLAKVDEGRS